MQSKPGHHLAPIERVRYKEDESLCVVKTLIEYLRRMKPQRKKGSRLFISTPHQEVSKQTISNWIKLVFTKSGEDTQTFKAHSKISASVRAAKSGKYPIQMILKTAVGMYT